MIERAFPLLKNRPIAVSAWKMQYLSVSGFQLGRTGSNEGVSTQTLAMHVHMH